MSEELCVLLDEEFGYRTFFWYPNMSPSDFTAWWEGLDSVEGYTTCQEDHGTPLPGKLVEVDTDEQWDKWTELYTVGDLIFCSFFNDGDSFLRTGGKTYRHKGFDPHYYDPKPTDTIMATDGQGNVICRHSWQEMASCKKCQEREADAKAVVDMSKLSGDTEEEG